MQKTPDGEPFGPGVDYAKAVARALGYEPKIMLLPIARILSYLANGELDISPEFAMNEERKSFLLYPEKPCYITHPSLTVRADYPLTAIASIKDIEGMRIGYLLGAYTGSFFTGATGITFDYVAGDTWIVQNLGKLLSHRIDAILDQNEYSCLAEARRQNLGNKVRVILLPGKDVKGYVVISRKSANAEALLRSYNTLNGTPGLRDLNTMILEYLETTGK
jgi:ABC-type amino acid transport substrate-binding protein